jgi:hypothetical protein
VDLVVAQLADLCATHCASSSWVFVRTGVTGRMAATSRHHDRQLMPCGGMLHG